MSSKKSTPRMLPSNTGVRITVLKKISLSDDEDEVSSVASNDQRLAGASRATPRGDKGDGGRLSSASSTSLTLSISDKDENGKQAKGESASRRMPRETEGQEGRKEPRGRSLSSTSSSSSSSSSSAPSPSLPPRRRSSATSTVAKSLTTAGPVAPPTTKGTVTAAVGVASTVGGMHAAPAAPPTLSGHTPQKQHQLSQAPAVKPSIPASSLQPISFTSSSSQKPIGSVGGSHQRSAGEAPAPQPTSTSVRTFIADPSSSPLPEPAAPPAPATTTARPETLLQQRLRQYNRVCTDPNAQASALSRAALRLPPPSSAAKNPPMLCHQTDTAGAAGVAGWRPRTDPADVMTDVDGALGTREARSAARQPSQQHQSFPLQPAVPVTPTVVSSATPTMPDGPADPRSRGMDPTNRVAVPTRRLQGMRQHHAAAVTQTPSSTRTTQGTVSSAVSSSARDETTEEEEEAAAFDSTYAPCAAHQRRTAARAAFDKQLETRLIIRDDLESGALIASGVSLVGGAKDCVGHLDQHLRTAVDMGQRQGSVSDWLLSGRGREGDSAALVYTPSNRLRAPQPIVRGRW